MAVIDDLKNELYMLDNSLWTDNLCAVLGLLCFPVRMEYVCIKEEFLYERSGKLSAMSASDRKILTDCVEIAGFIMEKPYRKLNFFGIKVVGNTKLRNEKVYDICKLFLSYTDDLQCWQLCQMENWPLPEFVLIRNALQKLLFLIGINMRMMMRKLICS